MQWRAHGTASRRPIWTFLPQATQTPYSVRRAPQSEKTTLGAVHRRPQQEAGGICELDFPTILQFLALDAVAGPRDGVEASDLDLLTAGDADAVLSGPG
jgi:hypothetical protein